MDILSRLLVALVYLGAIISYFTVSKKNAIFFVAAASVLLIIRGLCQLRGTVSAYVACITLSLVDIALLLYFMLFNDATFNLPFLIILHFVLIAIWFFVYKISHN